MKYQIKLYGRVINEFATWKAADKYVRAYNKLTTGMHTGAVVQPSQFSSTHNPQELCPL